LSLPGFRDGKSAQLDSCDFSWQSTRDLDRELLRSKLANVQGEISGDGFGFRRGFFHQNEGPRDSALGVLAGGLLEITVERFAAAIERIAVVRSRKEFELKHAPGRGRP